MTKIGAARVGEHSPATAARLMNTRTWNAAQRLSKRLSPLLKESDRSPLSSLQLSPRSQSSSSLSTANTNQVFNRRWIKQLRLDRNSLAMAIVTDRAGNVYVSGNTVGPTGLEESDVFVAKYSASGRQLWFKQFGSDQLDGSNDIAVDQKGNVYVTGFWNGADLPSRGNRDVFVAKYDTQGKQLWFRQFGAQATTPEFPGSGRDEAYGVATDRKGNVYLTGLTDSNLAGTNAGGNDAWVAKYKTNGRQVWIKQFGTADNDESYSIASDLRGNIYLTGGTEGSLARPNAGQEDAWIAKFNPNGRRLWQKQLGTTGGERAFNVAIDPRGNAYIAGYTSSNLATVNAGQEDGWIARYSVNGKLLWRRQFGSAGIDFAEGIAVDQSGNAFVSGYTDGDLFGNNAGTAETYDAWIVRYSATGQQTWSEQLGSNQFDASLDVTVDRRGNVYTSGYTNGNLVGTDSQGLSAWFARYSPA